MVKYGYYRCTLLVTRHLSKHRHGRKTKWQPLIFVKLQLLLQLLRDIKGKGPFRSLQWKTNQVKGRGLKINQVKENVSKNDNLQCIRIAVDRFFKWTRSFDRFFETRICTWSIFHWRDRLAFEFISAANHTRQLYQLTCKVGCLLSDSFFSFVRKIAEHATRLAKARSSRVSRNLY